MKVLYNENLPFYRPEETVQVADQCHYDAMVDSLRLIHPTHYKITGRVD
ncbi:MAG: hypothetical protein JETT_1364 [Candidatus Jettenia ecosi]|uniref:Uncharacterized protein n=1 Tax=Candidatus Jettenia ecosi TaxID=2494326 RepID=A0A533QCD6_9BACT|nr:MAG: hypothetical protein JETT_1364 [Candidatus Jettenia ecosi]